MRPPIAVLASLALAFIAAVPPTYAAPPPGRSVQPLSPATGITLPNSTAAHNVATDAAAHNVATDTTARNFATGITRSNVTTSTTARNFAPGATTSKVTTSTTARNLALGTTTTDGFPANLPSSVTFTPPAQTQPFTPGIPVVGTMHITGPLDDFVGECIGFGCGDPWPNNHFISATTPAWTQGGLPAVDAPHMAAIGVATGSPSFQVNLGFDSNGSLPGAVDTPAPGVLAVRRGDVANFEVTLYSCVAPQTQADNTNAQIEDQNATAMAANPKAVPQPLVPATAPTSPDCTDYANHQGNWQQVGDSSASLGLPGPNQGTQVPLLVSDSTSFNLSTLDVARTYALVLREYLQQTPGTGATNVGNNTMALADQYTYPFDVALVPAIAYQGKVQPFTLLYQPPGNESSPNFTLSTAYGTQVQAGGTSTISNYVTDDKNRSIQTAARIGFDFQVGEPIGVNVGGGFDFGNTQFWDTSTQWGMGTTATTQDTQTLDSATSVTWSHPNNVHLIPGNGRTCQVNKQGQTDPASYQYDCTNLVNPPMNVAGERFAFEPYWYDEFVLIVHPQYAVWTANGQTRHIMVGASSFVTVPIYQLDDCWNGRTIGNPCHLDYVDPQVKIQNRLQWSSASGSVDLTQAEAFNLLKLDPFWYAGSQAAALDITRALPTTNNPSSYGMYVEDDRHHAPPTAAGLAKSNTADNTHTGTASMEYAMTVTDTVGSSAFQGTDLNMAGTGGKFTVTNGESQTTMNQVQLTYTDSTSVRATTTTTDGATLGDEDNVYQSEQGTACTECHGPLPSRPQVGVYLDRVFGTFMFQDPNAPCGSQLCAKQTLNSSNLKPTTTSTSVGSAIFSDQTAVSASGPSGPVSPKPPIKLSTSLKP